MDEIPPPEAFEPQPDEAAGAGRLRRRLRVALTLIVVAAIVVLAAIEGGGFIIRGEAVGTEAPPARARLVVVDAGGALSTVDERGDSLVAYPVPGVTFKFPAWSPDGTRFAAIGAGADGSGIYVFAPTAAGSAAASQPGPVVAYHSADRPPFYLYWTPDSLQIAFLTTETVGLALRLVAAAAGASPSIVRLGAPMYWDFVDPDRLLVHSGLSEPDGFFGEVDATGAPFEGTSASAGVFRAPDVSVDGRYRAYVGVGDGAIGEIVREARDGSGTTRIRVFGEAAVSFAPQSDLLAFIGPDQATSGALPLPVGPLRVLDPGGAEPRVLLTGSVVAFVWSPSGKDIAAFAIANPDDSVTQAKRGGGARLAMAGAGTQEAAAGLALRLAFVDVATGRIRSERTVRLSDLFVNQVLPFFDQYALSHRFWSPDGAAIVLPVLDEGDVTKLMVIPADGSEARAIATGEIGFWSP